MTGHPFDAIADGIDALPAMVPGVCMPAGPQVDQLASWLRWTPCRDAVVESAVPSSLAVVARGAAPGPYEGRCGEVSPMSRYWSKPAICALPATHAGWHRSDDGAEWSRDITPRVESANECEDVPGGGEELATFARWLIAMDDPDDADGMRARQTVTLTSIIAQARAALAADRAPATDGGAS